MKQKLQSRFAAMRVCLAHRDYWPADIGLRALVHLAEHRWIIERDYQELKQELGLGHYEGRGWRGFHHHATLCIAAYGFPVAERSRFSPQPKSVILDYQRPSHRRTSDRAVRRIRPERHNPRSITTLRMVLARTPVRRDHSMSLLRITLRLILGVNVRVHHASCKARVIWRRPPGIIQQFYPAQFLEDDATPILRRPDRPQSALAFASILITKHARLAQSITTEPMRAKQPREIFVDGADGLPVRDRSPNQAVHVLYRLDFCCNDTHPSFNLPLGELSHTPHSVYNTVVLVGPNSDTYTSHDRPRTLWMERAADGFQMIESEVRGPSILRVSPRGGRFPQPVR